MKRMKRDAIVVLLIEKLRERGSWCGETHVQKATYFLQEMLHLKTAFEYILYKHGPFSFDLRDELTALRADDFVDLELKAPSNGASLVAGKNADSLKRQFPRTLERELPRINFVADRVGDKNVVELERLATALYVTRTSEGARSAKERAEEITQLKPHVSREDAVRAVEMIDEWLSEVDGEFQAESAEA